MSKSLTEFQLSEGRYNARDVLSTVKLYKPLAQALTQHNVINVYLHDREMAKLALQMHRVGMPIDDEERKRVGAHLIEIRDASLIELRKYVDDPAFFDWIASFQAVKARKDDPQTGQADSIGLTESKESAYAQRIKLRRDELDKKWAKKLKAGKDPINFKSKVQLAAALKVAGVPLPRVTKSGIPKVSKETLESQAHNPAARAALNYQITASVIKTFVENLNVINTVNGYGWIHPEWSIHKITGRWGSNPNVQNWSVRAGGGAENLRRMARAPRGYTFVGADFAQLEARILAVLSRDPLLCAIFQEGRDIHAEMAAIGFPTVWPKLQATYHTHSRRIPGEFRLVSDSCNGDECTACKSRKKLRDMTKRLEYGAFYGGAPNVLWQAVVKDVPSLMLRDVEAFVRAVSTKMPAVLRWRQNVLQEIGRTKEVRSPFLGRRQTFPLGRVDPGVAYNYKAQAGGADLWVLGALDFIQQYPQNGNDARIIHNGHDSVLVLAKEESAKQIAADVQAAWERTIDGITFVMETKIGERWSDV